MWQIQSVLKLYEVLEYYGKDCLKTFLLLFREWSFLMSGTRAEEIFEELKKFLNPGSTWQKVLVPQHDLLKSFGTPTIKLKIAQKVFVPLPLLQLYNSFRTPDIEQNKIPKSLTVFLNYA